MLRFRERPAWGPGTRVSVHVPAPMLAVSVLEISPPLVTVRCSSLPALRGAGFAKPKGVGLGPVATTSARAKQGRRESNPHHSTCPRSGRTCVNSTPPSPTSLGCPCVVGATRRTLLETMPLQARNPPSMLEFSAPYRRDHAKAMQPQAPTVSPVRLPRQHAKCAGPPPKSVRAYGPPFTAAGCRLVDDVDSNHIR